MRTSNNDSKEKLLILAPFILIFVAIIGGVLATLLEKPTDRGVLYTIFAVIFLFILFLGHLPCLISSVVGTVMAIKAKREGEPMSIGWIVLGGIGIIVALIWIVLSVRLVSVMAQM